MKFAITEFSTTEKTSTRASSLWIHEVACYVRDTYEFLNEANKDQLLGYWNSHGAVKPGVVEYFLLRIMSSTRGYVILKSLIMAVTAAVLSMIRVGAYLYISR